MSGISLFSSVAVEDAKKKKEVGGSKRKRDESSDDVRAKKRKKRRSRSETMEAETHETSAVAKSSSEDEEEREEEKEEEEEVELAPHGSDSEEEKNILEQTTFADIGLDPWLVTAVEHMGFARPTLVQRKCVPPVLQGRNCIASAETGSGKTAAFALPILNKLAKDPFGVFALVLTPTRELAMQISEQFRAFGAPMRLRDCCVIGGVDMVQQARELDRKPHVIVATPGRLLDHIRTNQLRMNRLQFLVLDEADRLLCGSLADEVEEILDTLPAHDQRQTLLFSATLSAAFKAFAQGSNAPYCFHQSSKLYATVATLQQEYVFISAHVKDCYLMYILRQNEDKAVVVFTSTCHSCAVLSLALKELEISSVCLHSQMSQGERVKALTDFKSRYTNVLIATDVASRGLDIPAVELVVNYDIPRSSADYVHRVGRTARAGRRGNSISLVTQHDVELVGSIEEVIGKKLNLYETEEADVLLHLNETKSALALAGAALDESGFNERLQARKEQYHKRKAKKAAVAGKEKSGKKTKGKSGGKKSKSSK